MTSNQYKDEIVLATFTLDDIHFAISTRYVQEAIILEEQLVPWPSSQAYVEGIMDLRGRIVPVINLKKRLGRPHTTYGSDCRVAIVALKEMTLGILFDRVNDVIRTSAKRIETMSDALQGEDRIITGVLNHTETGRLVEIIDPRRLVPSHAVEGLETAGEEDRDIGIDKAPEKTAQLVVFTQGDREYAVGIDSVREVEVVDRVDRTFRSALIHGSVTVHDCQLPLIHLGSLDQTKQMEPDAFDGESHPSQSVLILSVSDALYAVGIDKICEMITVKENDILKMSMCEDDAVVGVIQPSDGRSILVLEPAAAFRNHLRDIESMNKIFKRDSIADFSERKKKVVSSVENSIRNYLFFEVGELFAIELHHIQEILPPMAVIVPPIPLCHMDGILNLRKTLMPQFNMRSFLGLGTPGDNEPDNRKVIVLKSEAHTVALVVDNILNFSSSLRETRVPTLSRRLNAMRRIFKSLIVSRNETGESRHALRIDPDALVHELVNSYQPHLSREEVGYVEHAKQHTPAG